MDSFQLSYSDNDREEWTGLRDTPHVRSLIALGCAPRFPRGGARPPSSTPTAAARFAAAARSAAAARFADGHAPARTTEALYGGNVSSLRGEAFELRLAELLTRRRQERGVAMLFGLFGGGGYADFRNAARGRGPGGRCELPPSISPWSPTRLWAGLQFSGNRDDPVFFQPGRDVVIPQMLQMSGVGSHADQPTCAQMRASSPLSPHFRRASVHENRGTLLWFGGHSGHGDARTAMFRMHARRRGFVLFDSLRPRGAQPREAINMSLSSLFCWVPRGQGQGDPTRHMVALFHGCVPVFTLGTGALDDALPFDELLPWRRFSLRVSTDELRGLPLVLKSRARDLDAVRAMQAELGCAWRALFWTSLKGSCFGESVRGDAFDALIEVLRRRLVAASAAERWGAGDAARAGAAGSACSVAGGGQLPAHLTLKNARARLSPGTTWRPAAADNAAE